MSRLRRLRGSDLASTEPAPSGGQARQCRGWGLASRRTGLTDAEHRAGEAHLRLCRGCRDRLAALDRSRAQAVGGSAGAAGAGAVVAVTELGALGGAAGVGAGGLLAGKAGALVVGTLGAAVLVTGGATAATTHPEPHRTGPVPVRTEGPLPSHGPEARPAVPGPSAGASSPSSTALPALPPADLPRGARPPLPTAVPEPALPTPPLPLPSELPGLVRLPAPVVTLLRP